MSRTIADLTPGQILYLNETVSDVLSIVPYIYLGQDESGNCLILRQYAAISKRMHSSNVAVYDGCEADLWLEDEDTGYLSRFDAATRAALVSTQIKCNDPSLGDIATIARRCFLLSYTNLGYATTPDEGMSFLPALMTAAGTTNANTARITYSEAKTAVSAWLRSAVSETQFRSVGTDGSAISYNATITGHWLRPALSVAPATIVSDETEDTIYLLPDPDKLYREVGATIYMGESADRPAKAKLLIDLTNLTDVELYVSNNAKDAAPVWVAAQNGAVVDLPNTAKETENWQLGVKVYGRSGGRGVIGEPALIVYKEATT